MAAGLLASTLFGFGPLSQAVRNRSELPLGWGEIVIPLVLVAAAAWLAGLALLRVLPSGAARRTAALMGVAGVLWWAQGTLLAPLSPDYGPFDGRPIPWDALRPRAILTFALLWVVPCTIAAWFPARFQSDSARRVYLGCMLVQVVVLVIQASGVPAGATRLHQVDTSGEVDYSRSRNVIVLLVDAFQSDIWHEVIDREPDLARPFQGFTYFRNALAGWGNTNPSIQSILTAQSYDNSIPLHEFTSRAYHTPSSLPLRLKELGYVVDLYTSEPNVVPLDPAIRDNLASHRVGFAEMARQSALLIDLSAFRHAPDWWKRWIMNDYEWRVSAWVGDLTREAGPNAVVSAALTRDSVAKLRDVAFLNRFLTEGTANQDAPRFAFHHLDGIHLPIKMDAALSALPETLPPTRDHYLAYAAGSARLLGLFLDRLRELGIYEQSLVVITADHGTGRLPLYAPADLDAKRLAGRDTQPIHAWQGGRPLPLLLVKPFAAAGSLRISDAPVSLVDIPKTVLHLVGAEAQGLPGQAIFELDESPRTRIYGHFWGDDKSRLRRFSVTGFSWYADSWSDPEVFHAPASANLVSEARGKSFLGLPRFYGRPEHQAPRLRLAELNAITFARPDGLQGDGVGIDLSLVGLDPGVAYALDLEVLDTCVAGRGAFLEQSLQISGRTLETIDPCSQDAFAGWRRAHLEFVADAPEVAFSAEVHLSADPGNAGRFSAWLETGSVRDGLGWHRAAAIGVRNLELSPAEP